MSKDGERAAVRRLLRHWGSITYLCRRKQNEIAEYRGLIDAAEYAYAKGKGIPITFVPGKGDWEYGD